MKRIPVMRSGIVWIDLYRTPVLTVGDGPVEVVANGCEAQGAVSFGRVRIECNCLRRCFFRCRRAFSKWLHAKDAEPVVVISDTRVGERIFRIQLNRMFI